MNPDDQLPAPQDERTFISQFNSIQFNSIQFYLINLFKVDIKHTYNTSSNELLKSTRDI